MTLNKTCAGVGKRDGGASMTRHNSELGIMSKRMQAARLGNLSFFFAL